MFWISYLITLILASAIGVAMMAMRLVLFVAGRSFGLIPPRHQGNAASVRRTQHG